METPVYPKYYNPAGRYTLSEKDFQEHLERESDFYRKLYERAVKRRAHGIKLENQNKNLAFDLDGFNSSLNNFGS